LGVQDIKNDAEVPKASIKFSQTLVEFETVVALAEVLDATSVHTEWEREFQRQGQPHHSNLLLAFILAAHALPLVDSQNLSALPLHTLAPLLTATLVSFFELSESNSKPDPDTITDLSHVPSLAKLTAVIFGALLETRTYARSMSTVSHTFSSLLDLSRIMEQTYSADSSNQIPKQFLFTTLLISQSVLSSIVYLPPHPDATITPSSLALMTLQTLTHLSLFISQFGGITKAFEQLQKVFYLSIDIILAPTRRQHPKHDKGKQKEDQHEYVELEAYVEDLAHFLRSQSPETG
jgi:hypothetical protein